MYDINYLRSGIKSTEPYVFNIETTNACNQKCPMCPRLLMKRKVQHMTDADFELILGQIRPHTSMEFLMFHKFIHRKYNIPHDEQSENAFYFDVSSRCLTLHGYGEPLLDPHIVERVQACTDRGIPTYFSCRPENIDICKLGALNKAGLTWIKFSMNDFFRTWELVDMIMNWVNDTQIAIMKVATTNKDDSDFLDFWQGRADCVYVKSQDNRWFYDNGAPENKSHYIKSCCQFPWTSMTILSNGDIVPCTQDYDGEMVIGNIREQSLKDIWNGDAYNRMRSVHTNGVGLDTYKCKDRCDIPIIGECVENRH